ncbi:peptidylprolyl isomerase [Aristophania vespae]|uniref:Parvulin-like PPIase n=1 Tax=Aristophania vespae TaxID=2697033 RepID=A0A6P1NEA5_9PROT|nr:peptidylprolyl isomerase [Aristophania vespae]QHI95849.1 peptidylprolyl isomerase [Aristophania vespae]UMM63567.1 Chaperone SurA [Aristophania vespae]
MLFSFRSALLSVTACSCALLFSNAAYAAHKAKPAPVAESSLASHPEAEGEIIAVVNGQVLTKRDVNDRAQLFVLSTGLPVSPETMRRMRGQIIHQLIDERLKTQEMLRRHIIIEPEQIADAINTIEARNGMPKNALRQRLSSDGISLTTLIDQIRVQIGWMQVLRQELGPKNRVTPEQIAEREKALQAEAGRPQYFLSEIFVPVEDPRHDEVELEFTQMIIKQLRKGAPFPIVAAQFSQDQSALDGGAMGWVQEDHLDPAVVEVVRAMPNRAISNPIKVPGGYVIATVQARRLVGKEMGTLITLRQAFFPFQSLLNPQDPTDEQKLTLQKATRASQTLSSCQAVEELNKSLGAKRPSNPGTQILERLTPQMRGVLEKLPLNKATHPLVARDGIALLMVCSREQKNLAQQTPGQIADQLMNERIEQTAQQLQRALHRRAVIKIRPSVREFLKKNAE